MPFLQQVLMTLTLTFYFPTQVTYDGQLSTNGVPKYSAKLSHGRRTVSGNAVWDLVYTRGQVSYEKGVKFTADVTVKEPMVNIKAELKKDEKTLDSTVSLERFGDNPKQFSVDVHWDKIPGQSDAMTHNIRGSVKLNRAELVVVKALCNDIYGPHSVDVKVALPERDAVQFRAGYQMELGSGLNVHFDYFLNNQRQLFTALKANLVKGEAEQVPDVYVNLVIQSVYEKLRDIEFDKNIKVRICIRLSIT